MYWIYLGIFIAVVFTPHFLVAGNRLLSEEEMESFIIFSLGTLAFILYLAKEKALLRLIKEKLLLQKQTSMITRDLSDSYSYIGEMNRKFDIVKNLAFNLPKALSEKGVKKDLYATLLEAVTMLAKTDTVSLRFVNVKEGRVEEIVEVGEKNAFQSFGTELLLRETRSFWEEAGCLIARSPREANGVASFLIFPKKVNVFEDAEIFKILASEALFLYGSRKDFSHEKK